MQNLVSVQERRLGPLLGGAVSLRVDQETEQDGLDLAGDGERAYDLTA